jgi:hypothetical protein
MKSVFLDYSHRIPETGEDVYVDSRDYQLSAARICSIIVENLENVRNIRTPQDFLRHVAWMIGNRSINFRFDLALTYYLVGDVHRCREILRSLDVEVDQLDYKILLPVDQAIKRAAREIESDSASFKRLLDEWESSNVDRLGLLPSRAGSGTSPVVH